MEQNTRFVTDGQRKHTCSYFSKFVNESTMNSLIDAVENDSRFEKNYVQKYYPLKIGKFGLQTHMNVEYDIAINSGMIYWFYKNSPQTKNNLEQYTEQECFMNGVNQYFEQCKLEKLLSETENTQLFNHEPVVFYSLCVVNALVDYLEKWEEKYGLPEEKTPDYFKFNSFYNIVHTLKSAINLISYGDFQNANSLIRSAIETYFLFLSIQDSAMAITEYYITLDLKIKLLGNKNIDTEIANRVNVTGCPRKIYNKLNWVPLYLAGCHSKKHDFKEEVDFCSQKYKVDLSYWNELYNRCSKFSHGNQLYYADIWIGIYNLIEPISRLLLNATGQLEKYFDDLILEYEQIDLFSELDSKVKEIEKIIKASKYSVEKTSS